MTYVTALQCLSANSFHYVEDLMLSQDIVVGKYRPIQRARVGDDLCHVTTDITDMRQGRRHLSVSGDAIHRIGKGVTSTGGELWQA